MLLFSPCIVCIIDKFSDTQIKEFGMLISIAIILIPTVLVMVNPFSNTVMLFCYYYAIGVYIRKTSLEKKIKHPIEKAFCSILIIYIIQIALTILTSQYAIIYNNRNWLSGNNSALILIATFYIFIAFLQTKVFHNRIINFFSAAAFGVYLIHDNSFVREWLWSKCISLQYIETIHKFFLMPVLILLAIVLYFNCALIDRVRIFCSKVISKLLTIVRRTIKL